MPLNHLSLRSQIQKLAEKAVLHKTDLENKLKICQELLTLHADDLILLQKTVEEAAAKNKVLRCAIPVNEALTSRVPVHLPAPPCTLFAVDGSQITPDPHGEVLYGLVNVGVFAMRPGSGQAPVVTTDSSLLYDKDLQTSSGLASEDLIALIRDVAERQILVEKAKDLPSPVVTLTDGPLELYHEPHHDPAFEPHFKQYLNALDDLALNQVTTAGYIDRPRSDLVVKMLELLLTNDTGGERHFAGLTDLSLFEDLLAPGERSAVFRLQFSAADRYDGKKTLHFFYLNVSSTPQPAIARVDVPLWVIENPHALARLQSTLVEQARQAGSQPYPYPLIRAHEIAVVKMTDRAELTALIQAELAKHGIKPGINSFKKSQKLNLG